MRIDQETKLNVQALYIRGNSLPVHNCLVSFAGDFLVVESTTDTNRGPCPVLYNKRYIHRLVGVTPAE